MMQQKTQFLTKHGRISICYKISVLTHQFDDLDKHPIVGGRSHEFEKDWCKAQVILRVLARQLTDDVDCR